MEFLEATELGAFFILLLIYLLGDVDRRRGSGALQEMFKRMNVPLLVAL